MTRKICRSGIRDTYIIYTNSVVAVYGLWCCGGSTRIYTRPFSIFTLDARWYRVDLERFVFYTQVPGWIISACTVYHSIHIKVIGDIQCIFVVGGVERLMGCFDDIASADGFSYFGWKISLLRIMIFFRTDCQESYTWLICVYELRKLEKRELNSSNPHSLITWMLSV